MDAATGNDRTTVISCKAVFRDLQQLQVMLTNVWRRWPIGDTNQLIHDIESDRAMQHTKSYHTATFRSIRSGIGRCLGGEAVTALEYSGRRFDSRPERNHVIRARKSTQPFTPPLRSHEV